MTKYIIEGNLNFKNELNKILNDESDLENDNICFN